LSGGDDATAGASVEEFDAGEPQLLD